MVFVHVGSTAALVLSAAPANNLAALACRCLCCCLQPSSEMIGNLGRRRTCQLANHRPAVWVSAVLGWMAAGADYSRASRIRGELSVAALPPRGVMAPSLPFNTLKSYFGTRATYLGRFKSILLASSRYPSSTDGRSCRSTNAKVVVRSSVWHSNPTALSLTPSQPVHTTNNVSIPSLLAWHCLGSSPPPMTRSFFRQVFETQ